MPDKDRPSTWISYRSGMCQGCLGTCCTMPVEVQAEDLIRLGLTTKDETQGSKKKLFKRLKQEGYVISYRSGTDFYMLASRPNGDCIFLHPYTRLCTVYDKRPQVCRDFPNIGPRPGYCPRQS